MNFRIVLKICGIYLLFLAGILILPLLWAVYFHEPLRPFVLTIVITSAVGAALSYYFRQHRGNVFTREGFAIVTFGWILSSLFGALPYLFSGTFSSMADAYFETMSGFTTTGASVMTDIEGVAKSILFWRSLTHWLGGMGIIVLFVAVFPFLGISGRNLLQSEVPGPSSDALKPKIAETARALWFLYLGFTVVETVLLMLGDMSFFESLCHTFGTMATGGFSTRSASIAAYDSPYIEWVITLFMLCAGLNFALYYHLIKGRWRRVLADTEMRTYLIIFAVGALLITFSLQRNSMTSGSSESLRAAAFQTASVLTTTGYVSADFDQWSPMVKIMLIAFMFIGGCAGSTGGGMKVIRVIVIFKLMINEIMKKVHPGSVRTLKISGSKVDESVASSIVGFFVLGLCVFVGASLFVAMHGVDVVTAVSSSAATLWNIGPGLGKVGATENYAFMPPACKLVLAHCMLLGRLELFTVAVLFAPSFWRK